MEAKEAAPTGAAYAIARFKELDAIEQRATAKKLSTAETAELRRCEAAPKLAAFEAWLDEQRATLLPKSPLAQAVRYASNHRVALRRYLDDGELSIDNNLSERTLRCVAIGRKFRLFAGNDRGGSTAAVLMSLISSCKLLSVDPRRYLRDLLKRLPHLGPKVDGTRVRKLLPDAWLVDHPDGHLIARD